MKYYCCSSCNKKIELKNKKSHLKSELGMDTEGTVMNKYTIMNPELCQINDIIINNVNNNNRRFEYYENVCKGKLVFDNDIPIDVKSEVMYINSVLSHNLEKYLKNKSNIHKRQGLEFSHILEMKIAFITRLDHMTYNLYIEQRTTDAYG